MPHGSSAGTGGTGAIPAEVGCDGLRLMPPLRIAQNPAADELLGRDPLALLIGMLLDQHMRQRSTAHDGNSCVTGTAAR